ncbi:MAG: transposase [Verrucomicrobiota bacterium]
MPRRRRRYSDAEKTVILTKADEQFQRGAELENIAQNLDVPFSVLREWFREQTISILFPRSTSTPADESQMPSVTLFR